MDHLGGKIDKDFRIWVELASKKRKCQRCECDIQKGVMFVRMGNKEKVRTQSSMCAPCFEMIMSDLSDEFQGMKELARPPVQAEKTEVVETAEKSGAEAPLDGPHCFVCGLRPEKCRCAWEAYR